MNSRLGVIGQLLAEDSVTEILVNGPGPVWVEHQGRLLETTFRVDGHELDLIIERILGPLGLQVDRLSPIVDARLPDGSRVNVVAAPLAVDGPALSIRRFADVPLDLSAFGPPSMIGVLDDLVAQRATMLVVGATSSGKTTLLNCLSQKIDDTDRIVTIEDTAELRLAGPHTVRLEARGPNSEGVGAVSVRQLVTTALRMRPDRLVIGEVRGAEAFDLLMALTSGHTGSLATCHALDSRRALLRLQMLASLADVKAPPGLLAQYILDAIDVVVHVARFNGQRAVVSIDGVPAPGSLAHGGLADASLENVNLECLWSRSWPEVQVGPRFLSEAA